MKVKTIKLVYRSYSKMYLIATIITIVLMVLSYISSNDALVIMFAGMAIVFFIYFHKRYKIYKDEKTIYTIDGEGIHLNQEEKFIPILCISKVEYNLINGKRCISVIYSLGQLQKLVFYDEYSEPLEAIHDILEHYLENMKE